MSRLLCAVYKIVLVANLLSINLVWAEEDLCGGDYWKPHMEESQSLIATVKDIDVFSAAPNSEGIGKNKIGKFVETIVSICKSFLVGWPIGIILLAMGLPWKRFILFIVGFAAFLASNWVLINYRSLRVSFDPVFQIIVIVELFLNIIGGYFYVKQLQDTASRLGIIFIIVTNLICLMWLSKYTSEYFIGRDECLLRGTLISSPNGDVPIEHLKAGQYVLSVTPGGYVGISEVLKIKKGEAPDYLQLNTTNGTKLFLTPPHLVYTKRGWTQACRLKPGDQLKVHGLDQHVTSLEKVNSKGEIYDVTTEPYHNFFANSILVHNISP